MSRSLSLANGSLTRKNPYRRKKDRHIVLCDQNSLVTHSQERSPAHFDEYWNRSKLQENAEDDHGRY